MKWVIVTCDNSKHIVPAQKWLFNKYAPGAELHYLDVGSEDINTWGQNVLKRLPDDEFMVFGLDDYLPIGEIDWEMFNDAETIVCDFWYDRHELGWGASKKEDFLHVTLENKYRVIMNWLEYGPETPYSVSCQFLIWRTSKLKEILSKCTTPWNFEVKHKCKAACFPYPVFRWIEESALSGRHPGKINVLGLRPADLEELIKLGMIDRGKIQYGMPKGEVQPFDINNVSEKYREFYL